jgi:hypothetical protein
MLLDDDRYIPGVTGVYDDDLRSELRAWWSAKVEGLGLA